jgi:hypothetical protein
MRYFKGCIFVAFIWCGYLAGFCHAQGFEGGVIYFEPHRAFETTKQLVSSNNSKKTSPYLFLDDGGASSDIIFKFLEIGGFPLEIIKKDTSAISMTEMRNCFYERSQSRGYVPVKLCGFPHFSSLNKTTTGFLKGGADGYPESGDICFSFEIKDGVQVVKEAKIVDTVEPKNLYKTGVDFKFLGDGDRVTNISSQGLYEFYRIYRNEPSGGEDLDKRKVYSRTEDPKKPWVSRCLSDELSGLLVPLGEEVDYYGKPIDRKEKERYMRTLSWYAKVINETEKKNALLWADYKIQEYKEYPKRVNDYQRGKAIIASISIKKHIDESNKNSQNDDLSKDMIKYVIEKTAERLKNDPKVKQWVDLRIDESVKRLNASPNRQQIVASIEKALENDTQNIVRLGHITKSLLKGYDIIEREKSFQKILELARRNDPCGAYRETLNTFASDVTPGIGVVASPIISEILFEATADIYLDVGNRIAHWAYENGYAKNQPRWGKDRFSNGSGCFPAPNIEIGPPMVPAVPNGTPVPNQNVIPFPSIKIPQIVPAKPGPIPTPQNNIGSIFSGVKPPIAKVQSVPFVPIVTPVPLPPGPFSKKTP